MRTSQRITALLATTCAAALMTTGAARAQTMINSGGSSLASPTYELSFPYFSVTDPTADFVDGYNESGSGAAQQALISNMPNASGGSAPFYLGASDATANDTTQVDANGSVSNPTGGVLYYAWNNPSNTVGKSRAGDLIIIPAIGTPITVPFNFAGVASNTTVNLSDAQLCGIFSGKIQSSTDPALNGSGIPTGVGLLHPTYRTDGSGTSFLFTQHLAAVCTSATSAITFKATTSFASLFAGGTLPSNFVGGSQSPGVQAAIQSTPGAIGYLSPDYTRIIASPTLAPGVKSAPYVAEVKGIQPTVSETSAALAQGTPILDPTLNNPGGTPTPYNPADPNSFVPVAANPTSGYPIVGFTTLWAAQCYSDPNVAAGIRGFIGALYRTTPVIAIEEAGGFTPVPTAIAGRVTGAYLVASSATYINGGGAGRCAGLPGR